jgi:hypothetical protein
LRQRTGKATRRWNCKMKVESDVLNQPPHKTEVQTSSFCSIWFGIDQDTCIAGRYLSAIVRGNIAGPRALEASAETMEVGICQECLRALPWAIRPGSGLAITLASYLSAGCDVSSCWLSCKADRGRLFWPHPLRLISWLARADKLSFSSRGSLEIG